MAQGTQTNLRISTFFDDGDDNDDDDGADYDNYYHDDDDDDDDEDGLSLCEIPPPTGLSRAE